jgi:hypothetical protein
MAGMRASTTWHASDQKFPSCRHFCHVARLTKNWARREPYEIAMIGLAVSVVISSGAKLTGVRMMKSKFLIAATAATFALAGGVAMAQQDNNNPAPSYGKMAPVQSKVSHIQDGNNVAPRYSAVAPVQSKVSHIQDGNNVAPRYPSSASTSHATAKRKDTHG